MATNRRPAETPAVATGDFVLSAEESAILEKIQVQNMDGELVPLDPSALEDQGRRGGSDEFESAKYVGTWNGTVTLNRGQDNAQLVNSSIAFFIKDGKALKVSLSATRDNEAKPVAGTLDGYTQLTKGRLYNSKKGQVLKKQYGPKVMYELRDAK